MVRSLTRTSQGALLNAESFAGLSALGLVVALAMVLATVLGCGAETAGSRTQQPKRIDVARSEDAGVAAVPSATARSGAELDRLAREVVSQEAASSAPPRGRTEYLGRPIAQTMHFLGAPWLTRDSREREEEPAKLLASLGVRLGQTVCDLGCGNGFYTLRLAKLIGPRGRVLAVDIQPEMLSLLEDRAESRGVTNVEPILGAVDDPRLPPGEVDLVLLVDVYHEFSHPPEMLAAIRASLRPAGRVALVEFRAEDPAVPIKPLHKMSQLQCVKEFTANGYRLVGQDDALPWQHVLFFARDDGPLPAVELTPWRPGG